MIPFGWSAGDLVNGINVIVRVAEAFKETGGAASKYQAHHDFAVGLKKTFASLKLYTDLHEHDGYSDDIAGQLKLIEKPWKRFQTFLDKYDEPLGEQSTMYKLKKAPRIVKWTAKDLSGEVEKLERAVHRPLESLNLLLSLQLIISSQKFLGMMESNAAENHLQRQKATEALLSAISALAGGLHQQNTSDHDDVLTKLSDLEVTLKCSLDGHRNIIQAESKELVQNVDDRNQKFEVSINNIHEILDELQKTVTPEALLKTLRILMQEDVQVGNKEVSQAPMIGESRRNINDADKPSQFAQQCLTAGKLAAVVLAAFAGSSAAVISQQPRSTSKSPRQYQHFADFEGSDVRFDGSESNVPTSTAAPWRKKSRDLPAHSQGNPDSSDDDPRDSSPPSRLSARNQVRELKSEDEEDSSGNDSDDPDSGDASGLVSKRQRRRKRQLMPNRLDRKGRRNSFDEEEKARNSRYRKRYNGGDRSSSGAARPDEPWIPSKLRPDKFKPKRCPDDEPPAWRIR